MKIVKCLLWGVIIFNAIAVLPYFLPPGMANYMPPLPANLSIALLTYVVFGLSISGIVGAVVTIAAMIYRKVKKMKFQAGYVVILALYVLTIPLGRLLFDMAMSV